MSAEATIIRPKVTKQTFVKHMLARAGIIASFMVGPAEIALSDTLFAKVGIYANDVSSSITASSWQQTFISKGALLSFIYLESLLIGLAMLKNKRLRGAYAGFEFYQEQRKRHQSQLRTFISAVINAPYEFLRKVGMKIEASGARLVKSGRGWVRSLGKIIVDTGKTNTMSTTGVVLTELGEKQSLMNARRVSRLSLIFALSWLPVFIGVQFGYRGLGKLGAIGRFLQGILGAAGHGLDVATTVNIAHPLRSPIGTSCILLIIFLLALTGWKVANYLDQQK